MSKLLSTTTFFKKYFYGRYYTQLIRRYGLCKVSDAELIDIEREATKEEKEYQQIDYLNSTYMGMHPCTDAEMRRYLTDVYFDVVLAN